MLVGSLPACFPLYLFVISVACYCFGRVALAWLAESGKNSTARLRALSIPVEQVGSLEQRVKADEERFELEKRAFFSKTWLFVCHQSKFTKPGDYHTFSFAGFQFFIVLSQDLKLRAFHNVCRHRAYTVVRKSCGTTKFFSCKYHGWQYDDKGALAKAPKFDLSPGFQPEENGLFEVKLLRTQEGLVRVNFDASTLGHSFHYMTSSLGMGDSTWIDGFDKDTNLNWKVVANELASQAQWSQSAINWLPRIRQVKSVQMLGPMAMLREMGDDVWCTVKVLPENANRAGIRCDFYARAGHGIRAGMADRYKLMIEKEIVAWQLQQSGMAGAQDSDFSYEVGGRSVNLTAILSQHQRSEQLAKRKLQPRIRLGQEVDDMEAEALCNVLDSRAASRPSSLAISAKMKPNLDW